MTNETICCYISIKSKLNHKNMYTDDYSRIQFKIYRRNVKFEHLHFENRSLVKANSENIMDKTSYDHIQNRICIGHWIKTYDPKKNTDSDVIHLESYQE